MALTSIRLTISRQATATGPLENKRQKCRGTAIIWQGLIGN